MSGTQRYWSNYSRRRFLGMSAMASAAVLGSSSIGLTSCKKEEELAATRELEYDAIVVGSGYSGAVAALRLGEAGVKTLVIEMGKHWNVAPGKEDFSEMTAPKQSSLWLSKQTFLPFGPALTIQGDIHTGVLGKIDYPNMRVYVGRGVGGGSLVNGGMAVTPQRAIFEEMMPNVNADEMYGKYFPRVNAMLDVNIIPDKYLAETPYYQFTRTAMAEATKAGFSTVPVPNVYNFGYMEKEEHNVVKKSALKGEVLYGNNHGKNSVDKNYLPAALGTGNVTIHTLHRVDQITKATDGRYELVVTQINDRGQEITTKLYKAKYLFLAAGTSNTNELLVKAREMGDLPYLSSELGTGWGPNGNIMTARKELKNKVGIRQSTMPVRGILNYDNPYARVFAEIAPSPLGFETFASVYLGVTITEQRTKYKFDPVKKRAILEWHPSFADQGVEATKYLMNRLNEANGGVVNTDLFQNGFSRNFTYHPLGGCILGKASDDYGRLKGYDNLYAIDGSMIPGNISVNPFITIAALAERCVEHIIKNDIA